MSVEADIQSAVAVATDAARQASPLVQFVDHAYFTDSTGDAAIRFEVTLADPSPGEVVQYLDIEPVKKAVYEQMADVELLVYFTFRTESEQRQMAAGEYYG